MRRRALLLIAALLLSGCQLQDWGFADVPTPSPEEPAHVTRLYVDFAAHPAWEQYREPWYVTHPPSWRGAA